LHIKARCSAFFAVLLFAAASLTAQSPPQKRAPAINLKVAADLDARLAKFKPIEMPFRKQSLNAREIELVHKLVEAANYIEQITGGRAIRRPETICFAGRQLKTARRKASLFSENKRQSLRPGGRDEAVRRNHRCPPGRSLYPARLTREEIEAYVARHPDQKAALYSDFTVVKRKGEALIAVPYHVEFAPFVKPAAKALQEAAALSDDQGFATFLRLRAAALLTDDYFKSDVAWLDLKDPKFDLILAPTKPIWTICLA